MRFPRRAGFTVRREEQVSDVFARAIIGALLCEISGLSGRDVEFQAALAEIIRREAAYVAQARRKDRVGGWSYFPGLAELPPDLDSCSAALLLFIKAAPEYADLCEGPIQAALAQAGDDGSFRTWIVSPDYPSQTRARMETGIAEFWGDGADVEVGARFCRALHAYEPQRFAEVVHRGARFICSQQRPDGSWQATWYWGDVSGTCLCAELLQDLGTGGAAVQRAVRFLSESQRQDGGWGKWESLPLDTAQAVWMLATVSPTDFETAIAHGVDKLLDTQTLSGYWQPSPWIQMHTGRAARVPGRTITFGSAAVTTAFCLRALLKAEKVLS
jgi:hypothetical protein